MQENIIVFPKPPAGDKAQLVTSALPVSPTSLIGREHEMKAIHALLLRPDVRLLTLTGTAGVGKTRLALQVALDLVHDFAGGVHLVSLAPLSDPTFIIPIIAHRLGLTESGPEPLLEQLKTSLRDKHRLLLLDNFEHVIEASPLLAELLEACPDLKILVTSREDNAVAIAKICLRLDGLPLAIELAAARIILLPPQALLARLSQRLGVLTSGARDMPQRQQTLRNTIAWSYNLLDATGQQLFRCLSVFVGGCTLEAAEAVCSAPGNASAGVAGLVLDGVASLVDKSLVQQVAQEGDQSRLLMLETIREYGLERLATHGEEEATRWSHAAYYLRLSQEAEQNLVGADQAVRLERLGREHDNLRTALRWSLEQGEAGHSMEFALRLGGALKNFWIIHGHYGEGRTFLERALAGSHGVVASVRAKALLAAVWLALNGGDTDLVEMLCEESLALSRELDDKDGIADTLSGLGHLAMDRGDLEAACSLMGGAMSLAREIGDKWGVASRLHDLAWVYIERGEYVRARAMYEECLVDFRELGDKIGIAASLHQLALVLFLSLDDQGRVDLLLEESLALWKEIGAQGGIALWSFLAGQVALRQDDIAQARSLLQESVVLFKEMGDRRHTAQSLFGLAKVEAFQSNYAAARTLSEESLALCRKVGDKNIAPALEGLAGVVAAQGEPAWAARLWGAAEALREAIGIPLAPVERADYESAITAASIHLGEKSFTAAWAQGRTLTPEQAIIEREPVPSSQSVPTTSPSRAAMPPLMSHAGLTPRELEVLRLLAQGLTSAQIAEQLVIGVVTVNFHVRSIYSKLGVSSRSAATRYAIEHNLV